MAERITSTYVEKTNADSVKANGRKDHLHIRGENFSNSFISFAAPGSPPHTWRKPILYGNPNYKVRDHLHIRGENYHAGIWDC